MNIVSTIKDFLSGFTPGTKKTFIIMAGIVLLAVCGLIAYAMYTGNMDALIEFRKAAK